MVGALKSMETQGDTMKAGVATQDEQQVVSLSGLSQLTGFPIEVIKDELLLEDKVDVNGNLSMAGLREALGLYLDKTMLRETDDTHDSQTP